MGFSATEDGFYTSGHPGMDSNLPNPLGIKKSNDFGETLQHVALEGETDFHTMGVGYSNEVIFALNPEKNSIMETNQYYRSEDGGQTFKLAKANGLEGEIMSVAVHPTNPTLIAAAGAKGIYLSQDKGETFEQITEEMTGTAVYLSEDSLWYGTFQGTPQLVKRSLAEGEEKKITLPKMEEDAVLYFAQNPQNEKEMTFVSFKGTIFQSTDGATSWQLLVKEGMVH
nr:group-specific protein [Mesobacillus foraminis]